MCVVQTSDKAKLSRLYTGLLCHETVFTPSKSAAQSMQQTKSMARSMLQCLQVLPQELQKLRDKSFKSKIDAYLTSRVLKSQPSSMFY